MYMFECIFNHSGISDRGIIIIIIYNTINIFKIQIANANQLRRSSGQFSDVNINNYITF